MSLPRWGLLRRAHVADSPPFFCSSINLGTSTTSSSASSRNQRKKERRERLRRELRGHRLFAPVGARLLLHGDRRRATKRLVSSVGGEDPRGHRNYSTEPDLRRATKTEKSTAQSIGESTPSCSSGSPLCLASFGTMYVRLGVGLGQLRRASSRSGGRRRRANLLCWGEERGPLDDQATARIRSRIPFRPGTLRP